MMKKVCLFILSMVILSVHVSAGTENSLPQIFSELNYALTVDWDQKDPAFYEQQVKKFSSQLAKMQEEGLTNQQLVDYAIAQIKDERSARDARTAFTLIQINKMSPMEARQTVQDLMKQSYGRGASWNADGGGAVDAIVAIATLALIAYAVVYIVQRTCISRCEKDCTLLGGCSSECRSECK